MLTAIVCLLVVLLLVLGGIVNLLSEISAKLDDRAGRGQGTPVEGTVRRFEPIEGG